MNHKEYLKLVQEVNRLRNEVHLFNNEEISESALDDLKHKITEYEKNNPELISTDSPNYTIAGDVLDGFAKFTHPRRVLSLNDLFSLQEVQDWERRWKDYMFSLPLSQDTELAARARRHVDPTNSITQQKESFAKHLTMDYVAEPKLDGMALILHYTNGMLHKAVTRGDSRVGEDVTENIKLIPGIPKEISERSAVEVRGELIMSKQDFVRLNEEIAQGKKKGKMGKTGPEAVFANPRNAVAGTIRNLDQSIIVERPMSFVAYGLFITNPSNTN